MRGESHHPGGQHGKPLQLSSADALGAAAEPGGGRKSVLIRLDPAVHAAVAKWAADDLRSVNAQIEWLLRRSLADGGRLPAGLTSPRRPGRPP